MASRRSRARALLALVSLVLSGYNATAQSLPFGVTRYGTEDGLSSDVVTSLLIDSNGFLWIGTIDGLNRYDGIKFRIYRSDPGDSLSISHNWVTGLSEDRSGHLWVTTFYGGLCRLDLSTDSFRCISVAPEGEQGLSTNEVYYAVEDHFKDGLLWLATDSGLYSYDVETSTIHRFGRVLPDGSAVACRPGQNSGACRYARDVFQDHTGIVWTADSGVGVGRFDPKSRTFRFFPEVLDRRPTSANRFVISVYEAPSRPGLIWVGVRGGVRTVESETGRVHYLNLPDPASRAWVHDTFEDSRGRFWFGTDDGLLTLTDDGRSLRVAADLGESVVIRSTVEDSHGQLWLGSWGSGLFRLDVDLMESIDFHRAPGEVRSFLQLPSGIVMMGSHDELIAADSTGGTVLRVGTPGLRPYHLTLDPDGGIWVMTADAGLLRLDLNQPMRELSRRRGPGEIMLRVHGYDPPACARSAAPDGSVGVHDHRVGTSDGLSAGRLLHITAADWYDARSSSGGGLLAPKFSLWLAQHVVPDPIDSAGVWFSTRRHGIQRIDWKSLDRVVWNRRSNRPLQTNFVWQAHATRAGDLLIATRVGLFRFVRDDSTFVRIPIGEQEAGSPISVFRVVSDPDRPSVVWMATSEGLIVKDLNTGAFRSFSAINSKLESRTLHDLAFDGDGFLWLATRYNFNTTGVDISRFDPKSGVVMRMRMADAVDPLFVDSRGRVHLGAEDGWLTLDPARIRGDTTALRLVLFDPFVSNHHTRQQGVWSGQAVTLEPDQRDLRIEYTAIDFRDPVGVRYSTFLEGYDAGWQPEVSDRMVRYTNLSPGRYTFRLRAVTAAGVSADRDVPIVVMAPWWRTSWAYALYLVLAGAVLVAAERLRHAATVKRERHRASMREAHIRSEVAEQKAVHAADHARRLEELSDAKSRFLANVSHEFRSPLTVILGLLDDLRVGRFGALGDAAAKAHDTIAHNAKRVDNLVRQLLELSRLESGKMVLTLKEDDLIDTVLSVVKAHAALAERAGVFLRYRVPEEPVRVAHDRERLATAIGNLLSNAIKYTEPGDAVTVKLRVVEGLEGDLVRISVEDTGIGIAPEDRARVFDRFERVDLSPKASAEGVGIGLALARDIVELHHGTMGLESEVGVGSTFWIELRIRRALPPESTVQMVSGRHTEPQIEVEVTAGRPDRTEEEISDVAVTGLELPIALIVDDNADVRTFLRDHFEADFRVFQARDGLEGFEAVRSTRPDIVVSDIMMPRMDGIELCRMVKDDPEIRDIPIILLTARAGEENAMEGLRAGADEYVTKPFSVAVLLQIARNLVHSTRQRREDFARRIVVEPSGVTIESDDESLLNKVIHAVESRLDDTQFTIDALAEEVGISRRQLQRRLPDLCGESPSQLVRRMRLERARHLLKANVGTVSEIAYATGYRSRSHFTAAFRKEYGASPSEYRHANGQS